MPTKSYVEFRHYCFGGILGLAGLILESIGALKKYTFQDAYECKTFLRFTFVKRLYHRTQTN